MIEMKQEDGIWYMVNKSPPNDSTFVYSVTVDDPERSATEENDIEPDSYYKTRELAQEHARRALARLPKADVTIVECVVRSTAMTEAEYKEHRDA